MENTITCPECKALIDLTGIITSSIKDKATKKLKHDLEEEKKTVATQKQEIEQEITGRVETQRLQMIENTEARIKSNQELAENELRVTKEQLALANKNELEIRQKQIEVESEKKNIDLTIQRMVDEARNTIREDASKAAMEQEQLKLREKDDQLNAMKNQIDELKRRAEVGSQQGQGEALELKLEEDLRQAFFSDKFEEVKKGQRGADIIQRVHNKNGKLCGTIMIESKNTNLFSNTWITKLRKDQQAATADIAVLITVAMPKDVEHFGLQDGIWISNVVSTIGLISALRQTLIEVERQKLVSAGKQSVAGLVYDYVTGPEFAMHLKTVSSSFTILQEDLEKEKRAINLIWKKREHQINAVLLNISGMSGSIEGISQKALPITESLEEIVE